MWNIKSKNQIACIYDNGLGVIKEKNIERIIKIDNDNITYFANDFKNHVVYVKEESTGLFKVKSDVYIVNTSDFQEKIYKLEKCKRCICK